MKTLTKMSLSYFLLFALLTLPGLQSAPTRTVHVNQTEIQEAMARMRSKSLFGFVILLQMMNTSLNSAPFNQDITFFIPSDRDLSAISISPDSVEDFLLSHSISQPLAFHDIAQIPAGTLIPSGVPNNMIRLSTDKRSHVFLNSAQIVIPNLCIGTLVKCHGISRVFSNNKRNSLPVATISTTGSASNTTSAPENSFNKNPRITQTVGLRL